MGRRGDKANRMAKPTDEQIWAALIPGGKDSADVSSQSDLLLDLYKMMVASSEALVSRRQGVNTFFLTANGALLTGIGLIVQNPSASRPTAFAILALSLTGGLLAYAWRSLLVSFGQLNTGKFAVINRLEGLLPAAIYSAEWKALAEGKNPKVYRSFTSRELWVPNASLGVYAIAGIMCLLVILEVWTP